MDRIRRSKCDMGGALRCARGAAAGQVAQLRPNPGAAIQLRLAPVGNTIGTRAR
jgi:hypothetical protein